MFVLSILWLGVWVTGPRFEIPSTHSLFHYLSSIGRLDRVSFPEDSIPDSPPTHGLVVVTEGISSVQTLIALRGEIPDWRRRVKPRLVSVVSFLHFCDLPRGIGELMNSAFPSFQ